MKIGLLVGRETTFPEAFLNKVNSMGVEGITAEFIQLGGTKMAEESPYRVIVDRISHEVKYYRAYLKSAVLSGTYVINNPFWWSADDKFFNYSLATKLGVAIPRTVCLPSKSYPQDIWPESLRNLIYPLDWQSVVDYVGLPAILKPHEGGGWKHVYKIDSLNELLYHFDRTGELCMVLQEFIDFQDYVRCFCIGKTEVIIAKYDPKERKYSPASGFLDAGLEKRIHDDTIKLNEALGYDMNTVEFAVREGVPYAIDFLNPAPDFDYHSITPYYFERVVESMSKLAIDRALKGKISDMYPQWEALLGLTQPPTKKRQITKQIPKKPAKQLSRQASKES